MNGLYDWGWLRYRSRRPMPPSNQLEEVGALAAMVDENQLKYSLDAICQRYGLPGGKDETLLLQGIEALGLAQGRKKINAREHIWRLPARYVGPYAETDAVRTLEAYEKLTPIIEREGTRDAYRLEVRLAADDDRDAPPRHPHRSGRRRTGSDDVSRQTQCRAQGAFGPARRAVGMDEINSPKWKDETFDATASSIHARPRKAILRSRPEIGMDGET